VIKSLSIEPFRNPISGDLSLPGSKSITNRALILAALSNSSPATIHLEGALFSRDTKIMIEALESLGFALSINRAEQRISIQGLGGQIPNSTAQLKVGNAGTAARFLTALLALKEGGVYHLDGDPQMRARPMLGILKTLEQLDAARFKFKGTPYHFPFTMETRGIQKNSAQVDARASSQILSALLLALPASGKRISLECPDVRPAYIRVTEAIKSDFGTRDSLLNHNEAIPVQKYILEAQPYCGPKDNRYYIEPDLSAASYFLALTLLHGGQLSIPNMPAHPIQGDAAFAEILKKHGLEIDAREQQWILKRTPGSLDKPESVHHNFNLFSDTFLTYAAIAPLINRETRIEGIAHTRKQETDRVSAMSCELKKLGQTVHETEDSLHIISNKAALVERARKALDQGKLLSVETYEDHRFAMSFAILGSYNLLGDSRPWLSVNDPHCCGKTFPEFFTALDSLR